MRRAGKQLSWTRWLLLVGATLLICAVIVIGGATWYIRQRQDAFTNQLDTGDLGARIATRANAYVAQRRDSTLVVGIIQRGKRRVFGFGAAANGQRPDGTTLFEIGSVTKVFTGLALSQQLEAGALRLDDPITRYLPADVTIAPEARAITLRQLVTHTSGLPRLPPNLDTASPDPYANYRASDLYASLATVRLDNKPGTASNYSNYGAGLLGHILSLRTGQPYATLIRDGITAPLGMRDTAIDLTPAQRARLVPGHDTKGQLTPNWGFDVLAPAGGLHSTADDLLTFLAAQLKLDETPLGLAMDTSQQQLAGDRYNGVGMFWQRLTTVEGQQVIWHNGGTGGYVSFVGFDPQNQVAIVALSNYGDALTGNSDLDALGLTVLREAARVSLEP